MTGRAAAVARTWRLLEDTLLVVLLLALISFAGVQIGARNLFDTGWVWGEQTIRIGVLWVGLLGAVVASREDHHLRVDLVPRLLPARGRAALAVFTHTVTALVCAVIAWHAGRLVHGEYLFGGGGVAAVPGWVIQSVMPVAFALMAVRHTGHVVKNLGTAARAPRPRVE